MISTKLRLIAAVVLLLLVTFADAATKLMSVMIDGAFIIGVMAVLWPVAKNSWKAEE